MADVKDEDSTRGIYDGMWDENDPQHMVPPPLPATPDGGQGWLNYLPRRLPAQPASELKFVSSSRNGRPSAKKLGLRFRYVMSSVFPIRVHTVLPSRSAALAGIEQGWTVMSLEGAEGQVQLAFDFTKTIRHWSDSVAEQLKERQRQQAQIMPRRQAMQMIQNASAGDKLWMGLGRGRERRRVAVVVGEDSDEDNMDDDVAMFLPEEPMEADKIRGGEADEDADAAADPDDVLDTLDEHVPDEFLVTKYHVDDVADAHSVFISELIRPRCAMPHASYVEFDPDQTLEVMIPHIRRIMQDMPWFLDCVSFPIRISRHPLVRLPRPRENNCSADRHRHQ